MLTIYIVVIFEKSLGHIVSVVVKRNINGGERVKQHVQNNNNRII